MDYKESSLPDSTYDLFRKINSALTWLFCHLGMMFLKLKELKNSFIKWYICNTHPDKKQEYSWCIPFIK